MTSKVFQIRKTSELPFYCRPFRLFVTVWLMMLATFELKISYTSYPYISLALELFAISLISFSIGYATVHYAARAIKHSPVRPITYQIDQNKLRRFHLICFAVTLTVIVVNWRQYGKPPIFGFFGADTLTYGEYGSLKQVLFPAFMSIFVTAPLERSRTRRWFWYAFGPLCALVYASRGYLLILLFQMLVVFSVRTTLSKKKIYVIALATLGCAIALSNFIGNGRISEGSAALLGWMQIKRSYYDWPTAYIWMVSYISSPISNMCWIVRSYHYDHPSAAFLYELLPGSWAPKSIEAGDLGSQNIVDGVHTYLAKYFLDFWWFGIFGVNYMWGLISGYLGIGDRIGRNYLTSAVLLACIGFLFFTDFITFLIIVLELALLGSAQRYFTIEGPPALISV